MKKITKSLILVLILVLPGLARADQIFGDFKRLPDDIEQGFSVGADFGSIFLTGERRTAQNPGFQLAFTTGYDIMKYISVEGNYILAIQEAAPPPIDNVLEGGINWYILNAVAKIQYPMNRWNPFIDVGGGVIYTKPSFTIDDKNFQMNIVFGAGIEYFTYLRHYSLYAKVLYHKMDLPVDAITISAGLKYTF